MTGSKLAFLLLLFDIIILLEISVSSVLISNDDGKIIYENLITKEKVMHDVVVAINQDNLEYLEYMLMQVSDPFSEFYGQYLTREKIALITTNKVAIDAVLLYFAFHGTALVNQTPYSEYMTFRASIKSWEGVFNTTFYQLNRGINTAGHLRVKHFVMPAEIRRHVKNIFNLLQIPPENVLGKIYLKSSSLTNKKENHGIENRRTVTPALLNSYYHIDSNKGHINASQSAFESLGQYYSDIDITIFQDQNDILRNQVAHSYGMHESSLYCKYIPIQCAEANLDLQYLMAISQNTPTTIWYQAPVGDDIFLTWILAVSSNINPPLVHSISYGAIEKEVHLSYATAFNSEAIKLGLQGVTIVASSGDDGVANFRARFESSECGYSPLWPASSAYVLSIGATQGAVV